MGVFIDRPLNRGFFRTEGFSDFGAAFLVAGFFAAVRVARGVALVVLVAARLGREAPPCRALEEAALEVKNSPIGVVLVIRGTFRWPTIVYTS